MKKPLFFSVSFPLYGSILHVFAFCDWNYVRNFIKENKPSYFKKLPITIDDDGLYHWQTRKGKSLRILYIHKNNINVISHEIFHAVSHILRDKGLKLNKGSEEAYAYLFGYVMNEVLKRFSWCYT